MENLVHTNEKRVYTAQTAVTGGCDGVARSNDGRLGQFEYARRPAMVRIRNSFSRPVGRPASSVRCAARRAKKRLPCWRMLPPMPKSISEFLRMTASSCRRV